MDSVIRGSSCWPQPAQELLLHAALDEGKQAIAAWERFYQEAGLDRMEEGTFRLLPQVYRNLSRAGYSEPIMGRLKGIYRMAWCKNQVLFHEMLPVLRTLREVGIPTMMLKGVALSLGVYRDRGARPMNDFDVLIPADAANRALQLFDKLGWRSSMGHPMRITPIQQRYRHAIELINPAGKAFDLHWHLLYHSRLPAADTDFWKAAWPMALESEPSLVLNPTHQLLHTCVHGLEGNEVSSVRWVSDAIATIRAGKIDWDRLVAEARQHDLVLPIRDALQYLQDSFHAPIPRSAIWQLQADPVSRFAIMEYHRHLRPDLLQNPMVTFMATYRHYYRGVKDLPWWKQLWGYPGYVAFLLRLPSTAHLPRQFARWIASRFRRLAVMPSASEYRSDSATQG